MKIKIEFDSNDGCTKCPYCFYKDYSEDEFDEFEDGFYCRNVYEEHPFGVLSTKSRPKFIAEFNGSYVEISKWCPLLNRKLYGTDIREFA